MVRKKNANKMVRKKNAKRNTTERKCNLEKQSVVCCQHNPPEVLLLNFTKQ